MAADYDTIPSPGTLHRDEWVKRYELDNALRERDAAIAEAAKLSADLATARETNRRLNARCQEAESDAIRFRRRDDAARWQWRKVAMLYREYRRFLIRLAGPGANVELDPALRAAIVAAFRSPSDAGTGADPDGEFARLEAERDAAIAEVGRWGSRAGNLRAALAELVRLKGLKDSGGAAALAEHDRLKAAAWAVAREVLAEAEDGVAGEIDGGIAARHAEAIAERDAILRWAARWPILLVRGDTDRPPVWMTWAGEPGRDIKHYGPTPEAAIRKAAGLDAPSPGTPTPPPPLDPGGDSGAADLVDGEQPR